MILWLRVFVIVLFTLPHQQITSLPPSGIPPLISLTGEGADLFHISIPAIGVTDLPVTEAPFNGGTWDFSRITNQAAHLQGEPLPGNDGNAAIGAHVELAQRKPGPFYRLNQIQPGAEILIRRGVHVYRYIVVKLWTVPPGDLSPLYGTPGQTLTLITCSDYSGASDSYLRRLIVRAIRVQ